MVRHASLHVISLQVTLPPTKRPPFVDLFFLFHHFTSYVSSHLTCSCTRHLAALLSPPLHVFASSVSARLHTRSVWDTHTHKLWFQSQLWHNPDSYSCLEEGKCVLCSYFPQKSRFSLPSCFDPHGMVVEQEGSGGLCQQPCVLAGGPGCPPRCHSLLPVTAVAAWPLRGAVTRFGLKPAIVLPPWHHNTLASQLLLSVSWGQDKFEWHLQWTVVK